MSKHGMMRTDAQTHRRTDAQTSCCLNLSLYNNPLNLNYTTKKLNATRDINLSFFFRWEAAPDEKRGIFLYKKFLERRINFSYETD